MPVYETLNLGDFKKRLRAEFGFGDEAENNQLITEKVNQAISSIVRRKGNFPWQRRELSLDLPLGTSGSGDFTQGSRTVSTLSAETTDRRRLLCASTSTENSTHGYLITAASSSSVTLQTQWRGSTGSSMAFTIKNGFAALPAHCMKVDIANRLTTFGEEYFVYRSPREFDMIRWRRTFYASLENYFTVVPDPLEDDSRYYIAIYPYLSSLTTLKGYYFTVPPRLVSDSDEPILPPNDREVIFNLAAYYIAGSRSDTSRLGYFDNLATKGLERMAQEYALYERYETDDDAESDSGSLVGPDRWSDPDVSQDFYPSGQVVLP